MKDMKAMQITPAEPRKTPPSLSLSDEDLPDIKNWKVGETYKIVVEAKQVSSSMGDTIMGEGKKKMNARFEILSVKSIDGKASTNDFEEFENQYSREGKKE